MIRSGRIRARCLQGLPILIVAAALLFAICTDNALSDATVGAWEAPLAWPISPIHATMLPTGRVLLHGETASTGLLRLYNPADSSLSIPAEPGYNLFCSAHTFISDGRILYTGGQFATYNSNPDDGVNFAKYYDSVANSWSSLPNMTGDRWYPTNTTLGNGDVLVTSGTDAVAGTNTLPQVWQVGSNSWRNLTTATLGLPLYPEIFVAPNGKAFLADFTSRYLDTSGTGAWSNVATQQVSGRNNYGSACVYEPGKILFAGGADPPTETAEVIDLNQPTPSWRLVTPMANKRRQLNLCILPDGTVLATGGSSGAGFDNTNAGVYVAELWNPATETWTTLASAVRYKGYHSFSLLLPSGKVLTGGQSSWHGEVYTPPYLFKGTRPTISSAPTSVNYGETFFVGTPDATGITRVNWVRLSSVTHSINMGQWFNRLNFSQATGGLNVTAPPNGNVCPPGFYMLFILNGNGVPSVAPLIQIGGAAPPPPPPPPPTPPAAPSNLTASAQGKKAITLNWVDNSGDETGFKIERSTDNVNFIQIATVGANIRTYKNTGLTSGTTYYYRVRATNANGDSAYSNTASARAR